MSYIDTSTFGTTTTSGAATSVIATYEIPQNSSMNVTCRVTARNASNNTSAAWLVMAAVCRATGNAVLSSTSGGLSAVPVGFALASPSFDVSGANIRIKGNGALLTDLKWASTLEIAGEFDT